MASSQPTSELSQKMEKMSVNGKRHADAPRYTPPHRKYAQANKSQEINTPTNQRAVNDESSAGVTKTTAGGPATPTGSDRTTGNPEPTALQEKSNQAEDTPNAATRGTAPHTKLSKPAKKEPEVADSWEEEVASEKEPDNTSTPASPKVTVKSTEEPAAVPKSTYLPPHLKYRSAAPSPPTRSTTPPSRSTTPSSTASSERRPEKTNAVAHRLIAGALGVKVPRRTEEQRAYDKAMREQEKKKRDLEREAKKKAEEDAVKAKAAIWDD
ncbi:hypothetical protein E4T47_01361 [Aureobasidium subglaciale]|nr:hypothetical protein E4T43_00321 [Aureobasidium subglaciale]KAI5275800.1 hypothetical protein E4T47_01361 [Aureobasidium subglaciale]